MKKRITSIVCSLILVALFIAVSIPASAATTHTLVYLPSLNTWTQTGTFTRSCNYSYVKVKLNTVYPVNDEFEDIYDTIGFRLVASDGSTVISKLPSVQITEGENYTYVYIAEGHYADQKVYFGFRGLDYNATYAAVSCNPM